MLFDRRRHLKLKIVMYNTIYNVIIILYGKPEFYVSSARQAKSSSGTRRVYGEPR